MKPDTSISEKFCDLMFGKDAEICFQIFHEKDKNKDIDNARIVPTWRYGKFNELKPWLTEMNQNDMGIYVMVNKGDGKGRSTENVTHVTHLFADLDGAPLDPILHGGAVPHVITETSPGRYHAFWKVDGLPLEEFRDYQKAIAAKFGADTAICDLPRVMRVPGFLHQKREPFVSNIIQTFDRKLWTPRVIKTLLGISTNGKKQPEPDHIPSGTNQIFEKGHRNQSLVKVVGRLRYAGLSGEALYNASWQINLDCCRPTLSEEEVQKLVGWGNKKDAGIIKLSTDIWEEEPPVSPPRTSFATLYNEPFVPIKWVIEDLLPAGLTILAGDPKSGKSLLALHFCIAIASGGTVMGKFKALKGDVLGFFMEDPKPRFITRMKKMLGDAPPPLRADYSRKCKQLPGTVGSVTAWSREVENPSLVVIDTFDKVRPDPQRGDPGVYSRDYRDVSALQELSMDLNIAILLIHHTNKGEFADEYRRISGSHGITGGSDSNWVLDTDKDIMEAQLTMVGREIDDRRYWLKFDKATGIWYYESTVAEHLCTESEFEILEAMQDKVPMFQKEIAKATGRSPQAINKSIKNLIEKKLIIQSVKEGKYVRI